MTTTTQTQPTRTPTAEQAQAIRLFETSGNLAIEAGAGAGKTSALVMLAEAAGKRRGQYAAFNKALVVESSEKFPANVACSTAHSLAFRAVGKNFAHRLKTPRMRSAEIAKILCISPMILNTGNGNQKALSQAKLAGYVMKGITNFCQSSDPEPMVRHLPYIDGIDLPQDGHRTYENNNEVMWDAILQQRNSQIVAVGDSSQFRNRLPVQELPLRPAGGRRGQQVPGPAGGQATVNRQRTGEFHGGPGGRTRLHPDPIQCRGYSASVRGNQNEQAGLPGRRRFRGDFLL